MQTAEKQTYTIIESRMDRTILEKLKASPEWNDALSILKEDGDYIDTDKLRVRRQKEWERVVEVTASILTQVKGRKTEFQSLVYMVDTEGKSTVYFESPQKVPNNNPTNSSKISLGCTGWSAWVETDRGCGNNIFCVFNNRKAYYSYQERTRDCKILGRQRQKRSCKIKCGC
jgi:hypothetical protein